jgi:transposase InsO family protein
VLFALLNKAQTWVLQSLETLPQSLPFPLLDLDSDNGSEFINEWLRNWCESSAVQFTRGRPYHKNGNGFAEQKNNACVRSYAGCYRFDSPAERDALNMLYQSLCPLLNYFLPTMKLIEKVKSGSRVRKVYEKIPKSPCQRLLESPDLSDEVKVELKQRFKRYNPVLLQKQVHRAVNALMTVYERKSLPPSAHK